MEENIGSQNQSSFNPMEAYTEKRLSEETAELKKFNWGAFAFGWVWGIFNGSFKTTFLIWVAQIIIRLIIVLIGYATPIIAIIAILIVSWGPAIYIGVKGNEWAWDGGEWRNLEHFSSTQKNWAIGCLVYYIVAVLPSIFVLIIFGVSIHTVFAVIGNPSDPESVKANIATLPAKLMVNQIVQNPVTKNVDSGVILVEYLMKNESNRSSSNSNTEITMYKPGTIQVKDTKHGNVFLYTFKKEKNCVLKDKNCSIIVYEKEAKKFAPLARVYYDNRGKMSVKKLVSGHK